MKETRFRKPLFLTNETPQPNKNIRRQTSSNTTLIIRFFRLFRGGRTAHNGLVGGSSPPGPTNPFVLILILHQFSLFSPNHRMRFGQIRSTCVPLVYSPLPKRDRLGRRLRCSAPLPKASGGRVRP